MTYQSSKHLDAKTTLALSHPDRVVVGGPVRRAPELDSASHLSELVDEIFWREEWRARAACVGLDTDLFFPGPGEKPHPDAVAACDRCPVINDCLVMALGMGSQSQHGIFGGTNGAQRLRRLRGRTMPNLSHRVIDVLDDGLELTVDELASRLNTTARSVQRAVGEAGTAVRSRAAYRGRVYYRAKAGRPPRDE